MAPRLFSTLAFAVGGFVVGAAYLFSGRNIWIAILTHGNVDTTGFVLLFFGLAD